MRLLINNAYIYDSKTAGFSCGRLAVADGKILPADTNKNFDNIIDANGAYLIPGLIDIHTHGRAGYDFCDADDNELRIMAASYLEAGVTTVIPTLASAPYDKLLEAADRINAARQIPGARYIGMHLEGRYLNPSKRGVQAAELLAKPSISELEEMASRMRMPFHITFAPELDQEGKFISRALELGVTVAAGHTVMTYDQATKAEKEGITAYSHLFNAMPPLHHREGGTVCAALTGKAYCELICDGMHISPGMIKLAYSCLGSERLVLVSDSMAGTGCPDGVYPIAGVPVTVVNGKALSADGKLGGSTLNLFDGMMNLMKFCDIKLEKAVACATVNPAKVIGIDDIVGSLEPGKLADMLMLHPDGKGSYKISQIFLGGEPALK